MVAPLNRPELAKLIELVHDHLKKMQPYKDESPDLFAFRRQPFYTILEKLDYMFQSEKPHASVVLWTASGTPKGDT